VKAANDVVCAGFEGLEIEVEVVGEIFENLAGVVAEVFVVDHAEVVDVVANFEHVAQFLRAEIENIFVVVEGVRVEVMMADEGKVFVFSRYHFEHEKF